MKKKLLPKRLLARITVNKIPPGVSKIRHYWKILVRHITYYSALDKRAFWSGIIAGILRAPMVTGAILVGGLFVDSIVDFYTKASFVTIGSISFPFPMVYIVLLLVMNRSSRALDTITQLSIIKLRNRGIASYREEVAAKFHRLNSQEIDREEVKDMLTKIESFWQTNAIGFYTRLTGVGQMFLSIVIAFSTLFVNASYLALLVLLIPVLEISRWYVSYRRHAEFVDDVAPLMLERNYYYSVLTDARTFPERKINGVFASLLTRHRKTADLVAKGYTRVLSQGQKETLVANVIDHIALASLKVIVLITSLLNATPVGHITYMLGYMDSLYSNSFDLQDNLIAMFDELTFIEFLYEFQDIGGFADSLKKGKHLSQEKIPEIALDKVSFRYPDSTRVILKDASITFNPGDKVMILGKDGSGKSSLLAILAGMYQLSEGYIRYNGIPAQKLARGQIKTRMSVVPEDFARYYMSLRENILLGDPKKTFDETLYKQALHITGLDVWMAHNHVDDSHTILGNYFEGSLSISSGHWQRIAIARAIYRNRDIFLLDQPFTYIDKESVNEIFPRLIAFIGKRTLLYISEDRHFEEYFNRKVHLVDYQLVEQ